MATLYTPEARTQGLDWLAGMVQNGQQLWQRERQLAQEAQRLQQAKQMAQEQTKQFWSQQARLAEQDEFQKRKFLYEVAADTRKFEWDKTKTNQDFGLRERTADLQAQQEERLTQGQEWEMDPANPSNQYRAAATLNQQVGTAQTLQEMQDDAAPTAWGSPDLPVGEGGATSDALFRPSGNPYAPGTFTTPSGQQAEVVATSIDKKGRPTSFSPRMVPTGGDQRKALRDEIDDMRTRFTSTVAAKESLPPPPEEGSSEEAKKVYRDRVAAVETNNQLLQRQADSISRDLRVREAQNRMMDSNLKIVVTPKFQGVAPMFFEAIQRRDPIALENLRVQVKPLADDGDPAAKQALDFINDVTGKAADDKKGKTGYF
jgi:hypothetical protein